MLQMLALVFFACKRQFNTRWRDLVLVSMARSHRRRLGRVFAYCALYCLVHFRWAPFNRGTFARCYAVLLSKPFAFGESWGLPIWNAHPRAFRLFLASSALLWFENHVLRSTSNLLGIVHGSYSRSLIPRRVVYSFFSFGCTGTTSWKAALKSCVSLLII